MIEQTVGGLENDPDAGGEEEQGLEEGRQVLHFAVAVEVVAVGGPVRKADGEPGHDRGSEIEAGMGRLGENAEASRGQADNDLEPRESDRRQDGASGRRLLVFGAVFGLARHHLNASL